MGQYFTNDANLKSELRDVIFKYDDFVMTFKSDLGVFSKDKIDFGSNLLIDTYIKNGRRDVSLLDVGCGYGIIGISLSKIMGTTSTMVDVNKRAVHLTNMNIKNLGVNAKSFESNIYSDIHEKYDVIISNPPIRAGKDVVHEIICGALEHLNDNGQMWCVIRKDQGAKSAIEKLKSIYASVEVINKSKGFFIIVAKNH